jgi:hypothetical protein
MKSMIRLINNNLLAELSLLHSTIIEWSEFTHQIIHVRHEGIKANISVSKTSVSGTLKPVNLEC